MLRRDGRKDDYAFFLRPVDVENVPGYAELVQHPMDLGTMTTKVEKGRYRSLEEFAVSCTVFMAALCHLELRHVISVSRIRAIDMHGSIYSAHPAQRP